MSGRAILILENLLSLARGCCSRIFYCTPPSVWLALFLYCLIPSSIMALSDGLLIREKMDLKKFASRIFQSFSSNFGGNFLSRGVQKNYQMTILFYFFNGIIIWIAYRASITAGLSQKIVELPFKVKFFQYFVFQIFCTIRYFQP